MPPMHTMDSDPTKHKWVSTARKHLRTKHKFVRDTKKTIDDYANTQLYHCKDDPPLSPGWPLHSDSCFRRRTVRGESGGSSLQ